MAQTKSGFITLTDISDGVAGAQGASVLVVYADTVDAATNTQSLTVGTNDFVAYFEYTGTTPTLPIRTGITFAQFIGADGPAGSFERTIYQNVDLQPDYPPLGGSDTVEPTGWTFDPQESETQRWKSVATFNDGNTTENPEVSDITFSGATAGLTFLPEESEVTEIGIKGSTSGNIPDPATQETTVLEFGGTSGDAFGSFTDVTPTGIPAGLRGVTFGDGVYVAVGEPDGSNGGIIYTSSDATTWTRNTSSPVASKILSDVAFGNNIWVAVGDTQTIITATDPTGTWTELTGHPVTSNPQGVAFGNGVFVIGTSNIFSSADGLTWTEEDDGGSFFHFGVVFDPDNGLFVSVGNNGKIATSSDGDNVARGSMTWTERTSNVTNRLRAVAYDDGLWVAVGDSGTITTSSNGTTWASQSSGTVATLHGAAIANGTYFATGDAGTFRTSTDGTNWSDPGVTSLSLRAGFFGNSQLVFVGSGILIPAGSLSTFTIDGDNSQFPNGPATFDLGSNLAITAMRDEAVTFINSSTDITGVTASGTGAGMDRVTIISDVGGAFSNILVDISGGGTASATVRFNDTINGTDRNGG